MTNEATSVDACYPIVEMDVAHVSLKSNVTEPSYGRATSKAMGGATVLGGGWGMGGGGMEEAGEGGKGGLRGEECLRSPVSLPC